MIFRTKRADNVVYSMTGDETSDDLMEMLVNITGKFTFRLLPVNFRSNLARSNLVQ